MNSIAWHLYASVVVALLVLVCAHTAPARLENSETARRVRRRAPVHLPTAKNDTAVCNKTDDSNSTACSVNAGIADRVKNFINSNTGVIYRALLVLGSISAIVVVYISFRYLR